MDKDHHSGLTIIDFENKLGAYQPLRLYRDNRYLKRAAVLVPLVFNDNEWKILFTRRTDIVESHRGQVALPGGAYDPEDCDIESTALREACEEIGLPAENVKLIGRLDDQITVSNFLITPIVAQIIKPFRLNLSEVEVSRVFYIPLSWLADRNNRRTELMIFPDGSEITLFFYKLFDGELLWGVTAEIVVRFLTILGMNE